MPVSWEDLLFAFEFVDSDVGANEAYVCRQSGKIYCRSDFVDVPDEEELPEDIDDGTKYVALPDKRDLDLGKPLVLDFAAQHLPDDFDKVRAIFGRRGAYARFKDLLAHRGALDRWYEFESKAKEKALREWCDDHSIEVGE